MLTDEIRKRIERNSYRILNKNVKIAIYPYGEVGRITKKVLEEFGVHPQYIIDNKINGTDIINFDTFKKYGNDDTIILLSAEKRNIFLEIFEELLLAGINAKNIVVMQMNQLLAYEALERVINDFEHKSVLDIGCGQGIQGRIMQDYGKTVTGMTISKEKGYDGGCLSDVIYDDFLTTDLKEKYDVIWVSHILEHIMDVNIFLQKMKQVIAEDGCVAITVPKETSILLPHIHTFSPGRLLRYLLCAGYDCRNVEILEYGYNISIILPKVKFIEQSYDIDGFVNESRNSTGADEIFEYLPEEVELKKSWDNIYFFDGDIKELNWDRSDYSIFL